MPRQTQTGHPMQNQSPKPHSTPITSTPAATVQLIEFTYCHDRFPEQAITQKHNKYDPLINAIQNNGWKTNPPHNHHIMCKRGHTRTFHREIEQLKNP
jgi:hypothetical protein